MTSIYENVTNDFNLRGFDHFNYKTEIFNNIGQNATHAFIISGWQFLGVGQELATRPEELVQISHKDADDDKKKIETPFLRSEFHLHNATKRGSEDIPYNSTLWFNGTRVSLAAPFLTFQGGDRNWYVSPPSHK